MAQSKKIHTYLREHSIVFKRTRETFGGLSNMAIGYDIMVGRIIVRSSEALYQACRYPHLIDLQKIIIDQKEPMAAKMESIPLRSQTRNDWDVVRVPIMRWCLKAKLACNWSSIKKLILSTKNKPIVEESKRDNYWGAIPQANGELKGQNQLGRLLMELREELLKENNLNFRTVLPLNIKNFSLLGSPIPEIIVNKNYDSIL